MIVIDFLYGLEVDHAFQLRLVLICYHGNNKTSSYTTIITSRHVQYNALCRAGTSYWKEALDTLRESGLENRLWADEGEWELQPAVMEPNHWIPTAVKQQQGRRRRRRRCPSAASAFLTCVVRQRPAVTVEDEPALLPRLDLSSHLDEEPAARLLHDGDVVARLDVVPGRLDVSAQVEVVLPHRQVAGQRASLWNRGQRSKVKTWRVWSNSMHEFARLINILVLISGNPVMLPWQPQVSS